MQQTQPALPTLIWLEPTDPFPALSQAWSQTDPAPGLLAAGGSLDVDTLYKAYSRCIFPWFSIGQPILWWSPDPRMVLKTGDFRVRRSFRKTLEKFVADPSCEIRFDTAFPQVIGACAQSPRSGQSGTWIVPAIEQAYRRLHIAGFAHSVETWVNGELIGGLYCVAIGQAVFGESMFSRRPDASKIALAALISFCRFHGIEMVDCQQATQHLASMGAREIPREAFADQVQRAVGRPAPPWKFEPVYWTKTLACKPAAP